MSNTNLQDAFLNQVRKDATEVKVALVEGTLLRGKVRGFDNFTINLHVGGAQHLIYKHAIAQLVAKPVPRREEKPAETAAEPKAPEAPAPKPEPFNSIDLSGVQTAESAPSPAPAD